MADEYIYDVKHVQRDCDGCLVCRCPHCQNITGIEGMDLEDVQGEQYQCRCGGWFEVTTDAIRIGTTSGLPANKGVPG